MQANVGSEHKMTVDIEQQKDTDKKVMPERLAQSQVAYTVQSPNTGRVCANCRWFNSESSWRPCYIVETDNPLPIVSGGYCDQWSMRPSADILLSEIQEALGINVEIEVEVDNLIVGEMSAKDLLGEMWKTKSIAPLANYINKALGQDHLPSAFATSGFKSLSDKHWIGWYTNDFEDKEGEWFANKGIARFVKAANDGLLAMPELWYYHIKGTRVGQANHLFHVGHFLVAMGEWDNKADNRLVASIQKWQKNADIRLSHGFLYNPKNKMNGVYHDFATFEITLLDNGLEANPYTPFHSVKLNEVSKIMPEVTQVQKDALYKVLPKEFADEIISGASEGGKALEAAGIAYKELQDKQEVNQDTTLILSAMGKMYEEIQANKAMMSEYMDGEGKDPKKKKDDKEDKAFTDAVSLLNSFDSQLTDLGTEIRKMKTEFDKFRRLTPRSSKSNETLISDDDKQANHIHQKNYEQGLGQREGLIQQMASKGFATLSDAIPFDDDMPQVPEGNNGKTG
jgi:hypothetical protein